MATVSDKENQAANIKSSRPTKRLKLNSLTKLRSVTSHPSTNKAETMASDSNVKDLDKYSVMG